MLGFFKRRKRLTAEEDLRALMIHMHQSLVNADSLCGIERHFAVANTFGTSIAALRRHFPDVRIEDDGPAMSVLLSGGEDANWDQVTSDVEYSIQQARDCADDPNCKVAIVMSLLAPTYFDAKFAELQRQVE
jgi:hypothetical protein